MNRYETYKDSGIPWLGDVPEHWEIKPLKFSINNISHKVESQLSNLRYFGLENIESFTGRLLLDIELESEGIANEFQENDVLFGKLRPYLAKVHLSSLNGLVSTEALVFRASNAVNPKFLFYFCVSSDFIDAVNGTTFGSKMPRASWEDIGNFKMLIPFLEEQTAIAHYLDTKLGEIDALIGKQQTLLEKLAEQRTAVITHAVTKGLNPAAPMKNSGVEWLGDVPAHWDVKRLKNSINCSKNGIWGDEEKFDENDMYCLRVADFNRTNFTISETNLTIRNINSKDYENRKLKKGDLLLEKSGGGDKQPVGFVVLNTVARKSVCSNFIAQLKLAENMNAQFWVYFHQFLYSLRINVRSIKQSTGIQNLDETLYFNELACYPPFKEQTAIADYLDQETAKIDRLCDTVNQTIGRLKEYRTALITQTVTGKIKVTDE